MKIKNISLNKFKRFENLTIGDLPATAKLVVLTGPNGSGKSSLFEGFNFWSRHKRGQGGFDSAYHARYLSPRTPLSVQRVRRQHAAVEEYIRGGYKLLVKYKS